MTNANEGGDFGLPQILRIVALDIGGTTGVAFYDLECKRMTCCSSSNVNDIFPMLKIIQPDVLILERFPNAILVSDEVAFAYDRARLWYQPFMIFPGHWKPVMQARPSKFPDAKNQHEQDAVDMIRFYLFTKLKESIEWNSK